MPFISRDSGVSKAEVPFSDMAVCSNSLRGVVLYVLQITPYPEFHSSQRKPKTRSSNRKEWKATGIQHDFRSTIVYTSHSLPLQNIFVEKGGDAVDVYI